MRWLFFMLIFFVALSLLSLHQISKDRLVQKKIETLVEAPFYRVKNGSSHVTISDSRLLQRLVSDETCIHNLTQVVFSNVTFESESWNRIRNLDCVTNIGFYDCKMVDIVIPIVLEMNVTEVSLTSSPISQENFDAMKAKGIRIQL
jgi:hypothetical protein